MFIPSEILNKKGELTEEEFKIMKEHTVRGYDYLKGLYEISVPARIISLQHHERAGGQGYPEGRSGERISILSRIVAVADVYDAMTSDRVYRRAIAPNEALEYIMANSGSKFDYKVVQAFSKSVIPYPEGSIVRLSNNEIGVVTKIHEDFPLRPEIKIIYSEDDSRVDEVINLLEQNSLVIMAIEENVPEKNRS